MSRRKKGNLRLWVGMAVLICLVFVPLMICSAAEKPRRGGTIVLAAPIDPSTLNPAVTTSTSVHRPICELFEGLVELDRNLNPLPGLAESWDISPDGLIITFHLAKNVKWHDGKPFTSKDVQFSLMEVVAKYHPRGRGIIKGNVRSIETPDDNTAVFRMEKPYAPLLIALAARNAAIIPRHLYKDTDILKNPHNKADPVGTGAFKLKEWVKGDRMVLVRNENYRKPGLPYLDRIIFKVMKDPGSRALAFEKCEVDLLDYHTCPYPEFKRLSSLPNVTVSPRHGEAYVPQIAFNQKDNKILANLKVRQAIYHAIDRQFICDRARYGLNIPCYSPIPAAFRDFHNSNVKKYEYNPAKANKLLDEAGYPRGSDGIRFKIRLTFEYGYPHTRRPAEIIKPMLKEVGIDAQMVMIDRPTAVERVFKKYDFDMFVTSYSTSGDPDIGIARLYRSADIRPRPFVNVARYSNPEVDRLFDEAAAAVDRKKRAKAYFKVQQIITEELPYIWLFEASYDTNLVKSKFKNCFQRVYGQQLAEVYRTSGK